MQSLLEAERSVLLQQQQQQQASDEDKTDATQKIWRAKRQVMGATTKHLRHLMFLSRYSATADLRPCSNLSYGNHATTTFPHLFAVNKLHRNQYQVLIHLFSEDVTEPKSTVAVHIIILGNMFKHLAWKLPEDFEAETAPMEGRQRNTRMYTVASPQNNKILYKLKQVVFLNHASKNEFMAEIALHERLQPYVPALVDYKLQNDAKARMIMEYTEPILSWIDKSSNNHFVELLQYFINMVLTKRVVWIGCNMDDIHRRRRQQPETGTVSQFCIVDTHPDAWLVWNDNPSELLVYIQIVLVLVGFIRSGRTLDIAFQLYWNFMRSFMRRHQGGLLGVCNDLAVLNMHVERMCRRDGVDGGGSILRAWQRAVAGAVTAKPIMSQKHKAWLNACTSRPTPGLFATKLVTPAPPSPLNESGSQTETDDDDDSGGGVDVTATAAATAVVDSKQDRMSATRYSITDLFDPQQKLQQNLWDTPKHALAPDDYATLLQERMAQHGITPDQMRAVQGMQTQLNLYTTQLRLFVVLHWQLMQILADAWHDSATDTLYSLATQDGSPTTAAATAT